MKSLINNMNEELKQQTKRGVFWSAIQRFSTQGLQFLTTIVLANFLGPAEYGTIAMLSIFLAVSSVFIDGGFINALTRKPDRTHADICTVFYFNICISVLAYVLLFWAAPLIAEFYEMPELCIVLRIIGISLVIGSFSSVQATLLTIKLDFKTQTRIAIISLLIGAVIAIILAYKGFSYWALVVQQIVGATVSSILYWYYSPWRPTMVFSKKSFVEMFAFGSKLLASTLLDTAYNNIYSLVIGKVFSASTLGNYNRAESYANFPSSSLTGVMQRVTYPVLCKIQDNNTELSNAYLKFLRLSAFVIFPLMMGLSALAYPFILLLIGQKWVDCVIMLQILCFSLMWYPVHAININLLLTKGRSDLNLRLEIIKKIMGVIILCIAIPMGIIVLCYSRIVMSVLSLFVNTYYTGKILNLGFFRQMKALTPSTLISFGMWGVIMFTNTFTDSMYTQMILGIVAGITFYLSLSYLFNKGDFQTLILLIHK